MLYSAKVLVAQIKSVPWSFFSYLHSCSSELSCLEPSIFECVSSNSSFKCCEPFKTGLSPILTNMLQLFILNLVSECS